MGPAVTDRSRARLRVTGRVQGVGFRWFVRQQARRLGLSGWVRNDDDGAVTLEVGGPAEAIAAIRAAVARGPDGASVEQVESLPPGTSELPVPFAVER